MRSEVSSRAKAKSAAIHPPRPRHRSHIANDYQSWEPCWQNGSFGRHQRRKQRRRNCSRWSLLLVVGVCSLWTLWWLQTIPIIRTPETYNFSARNSQQNVTSPLSTVRSSPSQPGWTRILPAIESLQSDSLQRRYPPPPIDGTDDFRIGKSCHWKRHSIWFWKSYWDCRECARFTKEWMDCQPLERLGKCPMFEFQDWNGPQPRSFSTYDPESASVFPQRLITSYGVGKVRTVEYLQPECPQGLMGPCFDLRRCMDRGGSLQSPIFVYVYPGIAQNDLEVVLAAQKSLPKDGLPTMFGSVDDPVDACLLMVHTDDIRSAMTSPSWNRGYNHYVYGVNRPIDPAVHYGMASIGTVVATSAQLRLGYDIPLPLPALWQAPAISEDYSLPRKWLLSFRGSIQDTLQPYYQHRWLASEYLWKDPRVVINVQCKHKTWSGDLVAVAPYDSDENKSFENLMVNATFGFCPGGSHVTSFRLTEVLSAGGIPVVLPEVVPPFSPEVNWEKCLVRVSQARIVDLPRLLAGMSLEEIHQRQAECRRLYQLFLQNNGKYGGKTGSPVGLMTPLKIWALRLQQAVDQTKRYNELQS